MGMIDILQLEGVQPIDYRNEDGCIMITTCNEAVSI